MKHYIDFRFEIIPDIKKSKKAGREQQKILEGEKILSKYGKGKEFHIFDERGTSYSSPEFAGFIGKKMMAGLKELVFVVGGPYGFSENVYEKAESKISLSKMTFSHQLARLLCVEQIYRAFTIIKGEPYHHE